MANEQQKAEVNLQLFEQWTLVQTKGSYSNIIHHGNLKQGDIAKNCGFAKSALTKIHALESD